MCQKQKIHNVQNILQIISFLGNPALLKKTFTKLTCLKEQKKKKKFLYMWEDGNIR